LPLLVSFLVSVSCTSNDATWVYARVARAGGVAGCGLVLWCRIASMTGCDLGGWLMMSVMTGRVLAWSGGVVAVVSAVVLVVYFVVAGFHLIDTLGVIGAVVGIAGLVLAVYGIVITRHADEGERRDPPTGSLGPRVTQRARVSGKGRVYQAGRDQTNNDK
jgi:hypothetical protein